MKARRALAAVLWLAFSHFAAAGGPAAAKLADFAWLVGYWDGEGLGGQVEDVWLPPRDGAMLGAFRLVKPAGGGFYELFAIEEHEGSLRFVVKHFHRNWVGWEEKDKALTLALRRADGESATFGGITFRRDGPDGLVVELAMRGKDGVRHERLAYRRRPL